MNKIKIKKIDLIKDLNKETGFSNSFARKLIDDLIDIITDNIKDGHLNLKNIGSFKIKHIKERLGRNPKTKEEFLISSRKTISFTASKKIYKKIN